MIEYVQNGRCRSYSKVPPGARILSVNGRDVIAHCMACGKVILHGQKYHRWVDGETCMECGGPS